MALSSVGLTCNVCSLTFKDREMQRTHMREPWHVYNIKRKMASLGPISSQTFSEQIEHPIALSAEPLTSSVEGRLGEESSASNQESEVIVEDIETSNENQDDFDCEQRVSTQCLFCNDDSSSLDLNLSHMLVQHGLFIPEPEHVIDMETLLGYLRLIVAIQYECLFCGTIKGSADGTRAHMRDRGHCLLNFDREPELMEFWDFADSENNGKSSLLECKHCIPMPRTSESGINLLSGITVESRSRFLSKRQIIKKRTARRAKENTTEATASQYSALQPTDERRVAVRGEMGLTGLSEQQRRGLMVMGKKMQKQEALSTAAYRWAKERVANKQKHYRASGPMRPNG